MAGPEAANNANAAGALVPLLALGLPTSATAAVVLVAFQSYQIQPGPLLFMTNAELVWALIASLFIGNTLLLVLTQNRMNGRFKTKSRVFPMKSEAMSAHTSSFGHKEKWSRLNLITLERNKNNCSSS